ncbi:hypothetical protein Cgig2_019803 [Carnegiea gigantea]|uniref:Methionyl/Leucyl tRNA synthetase domain-containing protein n=1 Tax=Carnegiea gigantea TaxID=171969 RepID=A0A9Q1JZJ2_9CARY|nr:hypothetical protein Cgig2_019803 [Carnegiea gigantea]
MAGRVHTMQNGLWIISFVNQINLKSQFSRRSLHFRSNPLSSSLSRAALFSSCSQRNEPSSGAFVLTTSLYYVNEPAHMGSAYTTIAADAIARFQLGYVVNQEDVGLNFILDGHRLLGKEVIFVTGTDEHGEKIATAAATAGSSPSKHFDAISQAYKAL